MASPEWVEIFSEYSAEELEAHITKLKRQVSVYTSQQVGQKSYVKDLAELRGQLSAAIRVKKSRRVAAGVNEAVGVTDFSGVRR